MGRDGRIPDAFVIGPMGEHLTRADLPPPDVKRWVGRRKAEVVLAVQGGLMTMDEACERYRLTVEEFLGWERGLMLFGMDGLKIAHAQQHRREMRH